MALGHEAGEKKKGKNLAIQSFLTHFGLQTHCKKNRYIMLMSEALSTYNGWKAVETPRWK